MSRYEDKYHEKSALILIENKFAIEKKRKTGSSYKLWIYLFLDIFVLYLNIYYFLKKSRGNNTNSSSFNNIFKNVDLFIIEHITQSYKELSDYINNKFFVNNTILNNSNLSLSNNTNNKEKKKIIIHFTDLYNKKFREKWIKSILEDKYIVEFNSENPDYLFYNIFGCSHLKPKYKNAIKIAHITENQIGDFKHADYIIGQHHINYLDRYYRRPFFMFQLFNYTNKDFDSIKQRILNNSDVRTKFCAAVISNTAWTDGFRRLFYKELNNYKVIDMGGGYHNNVGGRVKNKIKFLSSYKFSIAMENTRADGYISEKIIDAFLAGNIPIYYGDYMIEEYINPKSFILIKGKNDMKEKIEYIKRIDNDDELYKSIIKEKVLITDNIQNESEKERIKFLYHIFDQDKNLAKRIDNY